MPCNNLPLCGFYAAPSTSCNFLNCYFRYSMQIDPINPRIVCASVCLLMKKSFIVKMRHDKGGEDWLSLIKISLTKSRSLLNEQNWQISKYLKKTCLCFTHLYYLYYSFRIVIINLFKVRIVQCKQRNKKFIEDL